MAATFYLDQPTITGAAQVGVPLITNGATSLVYPPTMVSVGGNIAGDTKTIGGTVVLAGGNNVTLSGATAANAMTLSVVGPTQTNQTLGVYALGNTTGQSSSSTYDARTLSIEGAGIVSAGWSNGSFRVSATQSNQAFSASGGSSAFQTLNFANSNGLTFSNSNGSVIASYTVPTQTNQTLAIYALGNTTGQSSSSTYDARTLSFEGAGIVSGGWSNGSFRVSATQSNQAASAGNGSFAFQTLSFSNLNGVSFSTSAGSAIVASHNGLTSQSNQQISAFAASNTTQSSSGTFNASSVIFAGAGIASVGVTNGSVLISVPAGGGGDGVNILAAGTQTANTTGTVLFNDANGISFGMNNSSVITASHNALTSQSNQAFSAQGGSSAFQTLSFANANGFTFSNNGGSVQGSYTVPTQSVQTQGFLNSISVLGNTAGNTSAGTGSIVLAGGPNITLSGATAAGGMTLSISAGAGGAGDGVNILAAGTQTAATTGTVLFSNSNGVTFGMSNSSVITASVMADAPVSMYPLYQNSLGQTNIDKAATANPGGATTNTTASFYVMPWALPSALVVSQERIMQSYGTAAGTGSVTIGNSLGVYSRSGGTMSLITAWQNVLEYSQNSVTAVSIRSFFGTNSTSNSFSSGGNISASMTGHRGVLLGDSATFSLSAGQYYVLIGCSTQTANANVVGGLSHAHISEVSQTLFVDMGVNAATTNVLYPHHGAFSTTRSATDASVRFGVNMLPSTFNTSIISNSGTASARSLFFMMANTSR